MCIRVLFDKYTENNACRTGWGVSFLVKETVLFDTGENGEWLLDNMKEMDVDVNKINAIVISHDHWDHTGGLWRLLERKPSVSVYACPGFSHEFKRRVRDLGGKLVETNAMTEIAPHIYAGEEIVGTYDHAPISERALIVDGDNGISRITGCAHPGIARMVRNAMDGFPDKEGSLIMGGFHPVRQSAHEIGEVVKEFRHV